MRGTGLVLFIIMWEIIYCYQINPCIWREYGHERSTLGISSPMAKFPNPFEFVA